MNKAQQLIKEVKTLLGMEIKLAQMMLEDGVTTIEAESFEAGYSVGIVTEGGIVAMPVGEYILEDGRVLVVIEEGIIGEIKEETAEEAPGELPAPAPQAETPMSEPEVPQAKKIVESIVKESFFAEIEQLKAENIALKAEIEALKQQKVEVELSEETTIEPIAFNPENEKPVEVFKFSTNKAKSTLDSVFAKLSK